MNTSRFSYNAGRAALKLLLLSSSLGFVARGEEITRICVVMPDIEMGTQSLAVAPSLQSTFVQYLLRPNLSAVSVVGRAADQLQAEADRKRCNFLLYSQILQGKKSKHVGRKFANFGIQAATGLPISVGSANDLRDTKFSYRLVDTSGKQTLLSGADHIKPKNDTQNILSLIAEKESTSVVKFIASSNLTREAVNR